MIQVNHLKIFTSLAFCLASVCFFYGLGHYGLLHNNEGLYAEIPEEMLLTGNYVIPYLNGVPYIEKPPLLYWLIALAYRIFGIHDYAARMVPAFAGFLTLGVCHIFARAFLSTRAAFLTTLILGTSIGFIVLSRMVFFDVLFTFFLSSALCCYIAWYQTHRLYLLRTGYALLAFAVLTKGLTALVLTAVLLTSFNIINKLPLKKWLQPFDLWGIIIFTSLSFPWHLAAAWQDPDFSWFYFINEHFLRFLGQRQPRDYYHGPIYYYTYRILIYLLPWSFLLTAFLRKPKPKNEERACGNIQNFLLAWFWSFFIFFSLSQAKANYYLVTVLPPLVLLLASRVDLLMEQADTFLRKLNYIWILFFTVLVSLALALKYGVIVEFPGCHNREVKACMENFPGWTGILQWLIAFSSLYAYRKTQCTKSSFLLLGSNSTLLVVTALHMAACYQDSFSARNIVKKLKLSPDNSCLFRDFEKISSFVFYMGKPLPVIDSQSNDLLYGQVKQLRPELFLSSSDPCLKFRCQHVIAFGQNANDFLRVYPHYKISHQIARITVLSNKEALTSNAGQACP